MLLEFGESTFILLVRVDEGKMHARDVSGIQKDLRKSLPSQMKRRTRQ